MSEQTKTYSLPDALREALRINGYLVRLPFAYKPEKRNYNGKEVIMSDCFYINHSDSMAEEWDETGYSDEEVLATDWQVLSDLPTEKGGEG